jgi:hypothetical protein
MDVEPVAVTLPTTPKPLAVTNQDTFTPVEALLFASTLHNTPAISVPFPTPSTGPVILALPTPSIDTPSRKRRRPAGTIHPYDYLLIMNKVRAYWNAKSQTRYRSREIIPAIEAVTGSSDIKSKVKEKIGVWYALFSNCPDYIEQFIKSDVRDDWLTIYNVIPENSGDIFYENPRVYLQYLQELVTTSHAESRVLGEDSYPVVVRKVLGEHGLVERYEEQVSKAGRGNNRVKFVNGDPAKKSV